MPRVRAVVERDMVTRVMARPERNCVERQGELAGSEAESEWTYAAKVVWSDRVELSKRNKDVVHPARKRRQRTTEPRPQRHKQWRVPASSTHQLRPPSRTDKSNSHSLQSLLPPHHKPHDQASHHLRPNEAKHLFLRKPSEPLESQPRQYAPDGDKSQEGVSRPLEEEDRMRGYGGGAGADRAGAGVGGDGVRGFAASLERRFSDLVVDRGVVTLVGGVGRGEVLVV